MARPRAGFMLEPEYYENHVKPFQLFCELQIPRQQFESTPAHCVTDIHISGALVTADTLADSLVIKRDRDGYPIMPTWNIETPRAFGEVREVLAQYLKMAWGKF